MILYYFMLVNSSICSVPIHFMTIYTQSLQVEDFSKFFILESLASITII